MEVALLDQRIDAIIHSLKDLSTDFPGGCELGAVLEREDPSDALVMRQGLSYTSLDQMPSGSVIGTSSVRRVAQLRRCYPKLLFADVVRLPLRLHATETIHTDTTTVLTPVYQQRGNLQTRLKKLDAPEIKYSALILASAGLIRLGLADRITATVTSPILYHAVGQGAIGVEIRSSDPRVAEIIGSLEDWKTGWTTRAERSMLKVLQGGCSVPVGCETFLVEEVDAAMCPVVGATATSTSLPKIDGHAMRNGISNGLPLGHPARRTSPHDPHSATLTLTGSITSLAGTKSIVRTESRLIHSIAEAEDLGADIAQQLIAGGGRAILEELGRHVKEVGGEDGKELPFESTRPIDIVGGGGATKNGHGHANGYTVDTGPKSPHPKSPHSRTVFKEGEVCLRPAGW